MSRSTDDAPMADEAPHLLHPVMKQTNLRKVVV